MPCSSARHLSNPLKRNIRRYTTPSSRSNPQQQQQQKKRVVFSGIQPTGTPHLGNYLGAISNWVRLQGQSQVDIFYSVVGLHAITLPQDPVQLRKERREMLAALLACGVDPERSTLFHQDQVPEHAELAWILNCYTSVGRLQRMTTWKSRLATSRNANSEEEVDDSMLQLGLLAYPVLQAADILLYNTTEVPVGEDQKQHIELVRDIALAFNRQYRQPVFQVPNHTFTEQARVASLRQPTLKMSKSHPDPKSRILLTDTSDQVHSKIRGAVTDSLGDVSVNIHERPGIFNLLSICAGLDEQGTASVEDVAQRFSGQNAGQLKGAVSELVNSRVQPIRQELERLHQDQGHLEQVEKQGAERARTVANQTLLRVKQAIGLA